MSEAAYPYKKARFSEPLILFILIMALIIYVLNAVNTQDWLWFASSVVDAHPDRIIIMRDGERTMIQPGHDDFQQLSEAAHASLSSFDNTNLINIGFGEESASFYDTTGVAILFLYDNPIEYHASFRIGQPTQLFVPIDGRHSGHDYFFRGDKGELWFGAMRMADSEPLFSVLDELGYYASE